MENVDYSKNHEEFYTDERCYITELHNTETDEDCSIARARVEPGVTTCLHMLKGIIERYVILEGVAMVQVGDASAVEVHPMDVVNIPENSEQRITNMGENDLVFLCICTPRFRQQSYVVLDDSPSG